MKIFFKTILLALLILASSIARAEAKTTNGSPVRLTIPDLSVSAGFQYNGLKSNGTIGTPTNIYDAGWYTKSVRPGEKGVAIVTGHVARIQGGVKTKPGVFSNLGNLDIGDKIKVLNDKGETITFVVRKTRTYDKSANAAEVFKSNDGGAHLNLITCDGVWDAAHQSYTKRLVVFADRAK
jgi:sortase A